MNEIKITNISPLPRSSWATVTLPEQDVRDFGEEATFLGANDATYRAVRGSTKGCKTVYRIYMHQMGGLEEIEGELVNVSHPGAGQFFEEHPWVADDLSELIADIGARYLSESGAPVDVWSGAMDSISLVEQSRAHMRWCYQKRTSQGGIVFKVFVDLLHKDPVALVWGKIAWSDRNDPRPEKRFEFFAIKTGEVLQMDFARRNGVSGSLQTLDGKQYVTVLNDRPLQLQDGADLKFSGQLLCFRSIPAAPSHDPEMDQEDIKNLQAAQQGPILGTAKGWDGKFLANLNTPRLGEEYLSDSDHDYRSWLARQLEPAGWLAPRGAIIGMTPGQTGGQEDFGACKGTYVVTEHDPRHIYRMRYGAYADGLRGMSHYESDGSVLRASDHPGWVTWNLVSHSHTGVSPDRLGKNPGFIIGTGWQGYDDQHYSVNNIAAYMALSDDPIMEDHIMHMAEANLAAYRVVYPQYGAGAPRAQGRTNGALAQLISVVDRELGSVLRRSMDARVTALVSNPSLYVEGPMKCAGWGNPDNRKNVFYDGQRTSWMSLWEHGLWLVGLYKVLKLTRDSSLQSAMITVANMMAEFGCYQFEGAWYTVDDISYRGGEAPYGEMRPDNSQIWGGIGRGGTKAWTFAGLLVARELLGSESPWKSKLDDYVRAMTGNQEAITLTDAEWWAAVERF